VIIAEETWEQQGDIRAYELSRFCQSWLRNTMDRVRSLKLLRRWQSMDRDWLEVLVSVGSLDFPFKW
jgi:hypothetical protein